MEVLIDIFNDLKNESSRTGKESILKKHEDNRLFREVLKFVYNPYIVTGISAKKLKKRVDFNGDKPFIPISVSGVMEYLKKYNSGRDIDIYIIQQCINQVQTEEGKELLSQIITKDLKVGITSKTINKVYGKGTIPEFSVMLAESYEKKESKIKGKFYITQKLDGNRCIAINDVDGVKFFTRQGKAIEGMSQLEDNIAKLPVGWVFDGELLLVNKDNLSSDDLFRATQKVVRKDGEKKDLEFYIFDALPLSEFQDGKSKKTYEQRRNTLELTLGAPLEDKEIECINLLPTLYEGDDKNMIAVIMKYAEEKGWEGLMVNTADGLYQTKRTSDLLKVKKMKTADLLVMSMEEGTGRNKGRLGRINVEYKGGLTGVGSGFNDEQRDYFWDNADEIVGKIVEIQYFEESKDEKTGIPSLRFPIFKGVRHDKTVEDISYD